MTEPVTVTPPPAPETGTPEESSETTRGGWLAFAGIVLLIATLSILRRLLEGIGGDLALAMASNAILLLTLAGITAGTACGLWAAGHFRRVPRIAATVGTGAVTGALASAAVLLMGGMPTNAVAVVAAALALAGAVGGLIAAIRPDAIVRGGIAATLSVLVIFFVAAYNSTWLLRAFGADGTAPGNQAANGLLAGTQALTAGLVGGIVAFFVMRHDKRTRGVTVRWPGYVLAGGMPGLLWIVGDLFARIGTARLLTLASSDAAAEQMFQEGLSMGRINTGLVLFFVGSITALVVLGRTLRN